MLPYDLCKILECDDMRFHNIIHIYKNNMTFVFDEKLPTQ